MRNIGIVGDGATDRQIFRIITDCILLNGSQDNLAFNYIELKRQNLVDCVTKYCREANRLSNGCYLTGREAHEFRNSIANILNGAFEDFQAEMGNICNKDILLLTTDSEQPLPSHSDYFKDWRFSISKILVGGIETFYSMKTKENYPHEYLPMIIPLVTFPSTEIFVAAARDKIGGKYGRKPSEWKQELYGTTNLATLREEDLKEKALDFITPESIGKIFQNVPESRTFIQTLSFGRYS